jgi:hypothetical protein
MRNVQPISTNTDFNKSMNISIHQKRIPKPKLSSGSIKDMYPVILDGGRTIIYVSDKSKENEIRSRYALRK